MNSWEDVKEITEWKDMEENCYKGYYLVIEDIEI